MFLDCGKVNRRTRIINGQATEVSEPLASACYNLTTKMYIFDLEYFIAKQVFKKEKRKKT